MPNTDKIKVCNVTMHYYPINGGQEIYINNLNSIFKKNNIEASVIQRNSILPKNYDGLIYFVPKIPKYLMLHPIIKNAGWFAFNLGLLFSKKILSKQDILLCHYPFHYPPISWHKKIIIISHGILWPNKSKSIFDRYHKKISMKLKERENIFIVANDTHFLREIGYDTPPGQNFFSEISKNVWFIPNCVDTLFFHRDNSIKREKIILVPRNIRPDRGIHLAIESFKIFTKEYTDYRMIIVGSGSGKYYDFCQNLVKKNNLQDKIIFVGHADKNEMFKYYNKSMVTLIPTIEKEGTSLSALESMSCGTATVVTAVAGLLDLPAIKVNLDPEKISDSIKYAIVNNNKISNEQQNIIIKQFNIELWGKAWLNIINIVKNKKI